MRFSDAGQVFQLAQRLPRSYMGSRLQTRFRQETIELNNWDSFIDGGKVSDTSRLTAASLLTLFTIKEDKRRKLRSRNEPVDQQN